MAKLEKIEDIEVWWAARKLCQEVYELMNTHPFSRDFALVDQINRSSGSVMDNIAEGFERSGNKEFIVHLGYAKGSCGETKSQLYRAYDRSYVPKEKFDQLIAECTSIGKQITGFITYLKKFRIQGLQISRSGNRI